jgi:uncharacterized protein (DUF983 family)
MTRPIRADSGERGVWRFLTPRCPRCGSGQTWVPTATAVLVMCRRCGNEWSPVWKSLEAGR